MKIGISNLSWLKKDNFKIINYSNKKINFLEYSYHNLIRFHPNLSLKEIRKFYSKNMTPLYSMQSLLYKTKDCYIFGNRSQRKNFIKELKNKISLAKKLKTKILVFGSPKNKKNISSFNKKQMAEIFESTFFQLAEYSKKKNICICIEANPKFYKNDFLIYTKDALNIVKKINSPNIRLNFDLGTAISNGEEYKNLLSKNLKFVGHIQISLPKLKNIISNKTKIIAFVKFLKRIKYKEKISVEQIYLKKNNFDNVLKTINFISNLSK
jgi:sugar phosphate isomerase/epimerase